MPYVPYLDLAIVFHVLVDMKEDDSGIATMLVRNEHLEWWEGHQRGD